MVMNEGPNSKNIIMSGKIIENMIFRKLIKFKINKNLLKLKALKLQIFRKIILIH